MSDLPDVLPARHDCLEVAEFETEFVVLDERSGVVHRIDSLAAIVFDACDGCTETDVLVAEIVEVTETPQPTVRTRIGEVLHQFTNLGLLEGTTPMRPPPCTSVSLSSSLDQNRG